MKKIFKKRHWTKEEEEFLANNWEHHSVKYFESKLKRSAKSIRMKSFKMNLGRSMSFTDEIFITTFLKTIGYSSNDLTIQRFENDNLPMRKLKKGNKIYRLVNIDEFWKWAEANKSKIDLSKMEKNALGKEPDWVKEKRILDFKKPKTGKWTLGEERLLISRVNSGRFDLYNLALDLNRTQPSVRKKLYELNLKAKCKSPKKRYSKQEEDTIKELFGKGASYSYIAIQLNRTEEAISDKIKRMKKNGQIEVKINDSCNL